MLLKLGPRPDWYYWLDPELAWCTSNVEQPGLRFEPVGGKLAVVYHISHVPILPDEVQIAHNQLAQRRQGSVMLPYEGSGLLRGYQQADLAFLKHRRGTLLTYEMRLGKQQPVDTAVLTPQGWRKIGDLRVGDFVVGSAGKPARVCGVFPQGVKPSYRVTFSDGTSVEAGPEHLWTVQYLAGGREWRDVVLTTEQLRTRPVINTSNDRQAFYRDLSKTALRLPLLINPAVFQGRGPLPIPAYTLGQLIANGSLAHGTPQLVCNALDWLELCKSFKQDHSVIGPVRRYGSSIHVNFLGIAALIRKLRLAILSGAKFIPEVYLFASPSDRFALLQGLMDGDGSISKRDNRVVYHTISKQLALDIRALVEGLGGVATVRAYDRAHEAKPIEYQVRLRLPVGRNPFRVRRKASRFRPGSHAAPIRTVTKVKYVREVESVCIQVDAPDQLYATEHCILTHNTALACHLHNPDDGILLVCGPLAAREAWRDWIERTTGSSPYLLYGRKNIEEAPGYHAYFVHYDVLDAHTAFLARQQIGTLVLDELHILQSRTTQKSSAVVTLLPRAAKVLGLTGTPCWNKPKSLHNILHMLTPGAWGSPFEFKKRYCDAQPGAHGWTYDGVSNAAELEARLATIMVRRTWKEVMPELPPTTRVIEPVEIPGAAYVTIEAATMKAALAHGQVTQAGYLATLRRKLAEVKIKPAKEIALRAVADGHKVVLWVWHNEIGDKLTAALAENVTVFRLQSADSGAKRESIVQAFRDAPVGTCVLVAAMGVAGVGLDLACANYAIFVELDWTPAVVSQAEMRTFHISRPHVVVYLHTDDPVENALVEALDVKNSFAAAIGLSEADILRKVIR
jgi:hypothetical protein